MTQTLIVKWIAKPGEAERIQALLPELAQRTRAEPGNVLYTIYQSESDPGVFILHECYADPDAVERHRHSEHYQRIVVAEIRPRLASREVIAVKALIEPTQE